MCNNDRPCGCRNSHCESIRHIQGDVDAILVDCRNMFQSLNGITRNNNSCECNNMREIRSALVNVEENVVCINEDLRGIRFNNGCDCRRCIQQGMSTIRQGICHVEEGLNDIRRNNFCVGVRETGAGIHEIEDGACDIENCLRFIDNDNCNCNRPCNGCNPNPFNSDETIYDSHRTIRDIVNRDVFNVDVSINKYWGN